MIGSIFITRGYSASVELRSTLVLVAPPSDLSFPGVDLKFKSQFELGTGRLWDDHLRHLGYPPKFYRVQDASSGNDSTF